MAKMVHGAGLIVLLCSGSCLCAGQAMPPVSWEFNGQRINVNEARLFLTATLAPGWHLYSQHLGQGGPLPTRFQFETGDDAVLETATLEKGEAHTYHDALYDMDITWYSGRVLFQQNIRLVNAVKAIRGTVEYMTCNDEMCIPTQREFRIPVEP